MKISLAMVAGAVLWSGAATADPMTLSDSEMSGVTAGVLNNFSVLNGFSVNEGLTVNNGTHLNVVNAVPVAISNSFANSLAIGVLSGRADAGAFSQGFSQNNTGIGQQQR